MIKELAKLKHSEASLNINYLLIPVTVFNIDKDGAKNFNKIYQWLKTQNLYPIERTPSGGIKNGPRVKRPAWDVKKSPSCIEITALLTEGSWRIQFRSELKKGMSGRRAFTAFKRLLLKRGIDLEKYAIDNGREVKKEIESPLIGAKHKLFYDLEYEHVNHIDFHSSYAGGLANTHPEFRETLEELYSKREEKSHYKDILNFSIGFMQSISGCNARWAHLSRDAIKDNNDRVRNLAKLLEKKGRMVLSFNTDGIWYRGSVFHGEGEGNGLGEWHNDHINCKFRMKSSGSYEFIENGEYYPVVRGISNTSKKEWKWGDIYSDKADMVLYQFSDTEGVITNG